MKNPNLLKAFFTCMVIAFCANALMAQETESIKNFSNFNKIAVSSGIDLYLTQGNSEKVVLKGSKDALDRVTVTKSNDGVLSFQIEKSSFISWLWGEDNSVTAYVTLKDLEVLAVSGGSDVYSTGTLNLNTLNIKASGGSDLKLSLNANVLKIASSGGSDLNLKGKVKSLSIATSGGSDVNAFQLIADDVSVSSSGGSDSEVYARNSIKVAASGASDVSYKGNPTVKGISQSGASDVNKVN